jgi:hypothetical protein
MMKRTILRHILPAGVSAMSVFALWVFGTLPMTTVFLIEDAFVMSEYVQFLIYALGIASGMSIAVLLPLALLGETLAKRNRHAIWIFPAFLCLSAVALLTIRAVLLRSLLDAILSWSGLIALISAAFVLYWAVLWAEKAALVYWRKFRERRRG